MVELPGAFVRGRSEAEILSKVDREVESYLDWLGTPRSAPSQVRVVERHSCNLTVEDADGEILLAADRSTMSNDEFLRLKMLASKSGETFYSLYDSSQLRDWVDPLRVRGTFYGENPRTIREVFDHVENTQHYYLSRVGLNISHGQPFLETRESCLKEVEGLFQRMGNAAVYDVDGELWTVKKVLRRFVWHDRIHGKAITRILAKQKRLGLIKSYDDFFHFGLRP